MKILIGIWHPAHAHFFKNIIPKLIIKGHNVKVITRPKEITLSLLDSFDIKYEVVGGFEKSLAGKFLHMFKILNEIRIKVKEFKPEKLVGVNDVYLPLFGSFFRYKSIIFTDDDKWMIHSFIYNFFSTYIITPYKYRLNVRRNHLKFKGFHELSYLHPNVFSNNLNLNSTRPLILFRLVSWDAAHDISQGGLSQANISNFISKYFKQENIIISSEGELFADLQKYKFKHPISEFHKYLDRADLVITDSQTTATEAALLGTPVVRCNSWVGNEDFTNYIELEKYKLIYNVSDESEALMLGLKIINERKKYNKIHSLRLKHLLNSKIDVSEFATKKILNLHV